MQLNTHGDKDHIEMSITLENHSLSPPPISDHGTTTKVKSGTDKSLYFPAFRPRHLQLPGHPSLEKLPCLVSGQR